MWQVIKYLNKYRQRKMVKLALEKEKEKMIQ